MRSLAVAFALLLLPTLAHAAKRRVIVIEEDEDDTPPHVLTVTISPLHLIGPFAEVTAEARLGREVGVALIGGAGRMPFQGNEAPGGFWDLGGQLRYYVMGDFSAGGMMVGAEVLYLHAPAHVDATPYGANLTASGFIGWKLVTRIGFTVDSQLGLSGLVARQRVETDSVISRGDARPIQLLGNLGVGWTF
jgi:hypothetical protein